MLAPDPYRAVAPVYEYLLGPLLAPLRRAAVRAICSAGPVLDCCCGPAGLTSLLAASGVRVVGLDRSAAMLARAPRGLRLLRGDAARLPFADHVFGAACVILALHEMRRQSALAVLQELSRVVRPGGVLVLADWAAPLPAPLRPVAHLAERVAGAEHYRSFRAYQARGGLDALASEAGLTLTDLGSFCLGTIRLAACRPASVRGLTSAAP